MINKLSKKSNISIRLIKNSAFLLILNFSNYFFGLLLLPYISRILSVENFGLIGFSMSYSLVFQTIVEFGFIIYATAEIARYRDNKNKVNQIISSVMCAKLILVTVSVVLFILSAFFIPMVRKNFLIVSLFVFDAILKAMIPDFFFRGIERMGVITIRTVLIRLLSLIMVALLVKNDSQVVLVPVAYVLSNIVALALAITAMYKAGGRLVRVKMRQVMKVIRDSILFFVSRIAVSVNQSAGAFLIGLKFTPTSFESGIFSGATRISHAGEMMVSPVSDSLYPHMVNKKDYRLFKKVVVFGGMIWFFGCFFTFVFANDICRIILGQDYYVAGDYLRIVLFGAFVSFFSNLFGYNALTPIGKVNHANLALLVSAVINIVIYSFLWLTDSINLVSVCVVIASTNLVVLSYRAFIFWKYRHLVKRVSK